MTDEPKAPELPQWLKDMDDPDVLPRALGVRSGLPAYAHRNMVAPEAPGPKTSQAPARGPIPPPPPAD